MDLKQLTTINSPTVGDGGDASLSVPFKTSDSMGFETSGGPKMPFPYPHYCPMQQIYVCPKKLRTRTSFPDETHWGMFEFEIWVFIELRNFRMEFGDLTWLSLNSSDTTNDTNRILRRKEWWEERREEEGSTVGRSQEQFKTQTIQAK